MDVVSAEARIQMNVRGLIVGIDKYIDSRNLRYCIRDATAFRDFLIDPHYGNRDPDNILLLTDDEEQILQPLRSNILHYLDLISGISEPKDAIIFYFAGHGDEIDGVPALIPADYRAGRGINSAIKLKEIKNILDKADASFKLILLDSCHSGAAKGRDESGTMGKATYDAIYEMPLGFTVLSACSLNQLSYEDDEFQHGIFTYYLLNGAKGKADVNNDGRITINELYDYITPLIRNRAFKRHHATQTPLFEAKFSGIYALSEIAIIEEDLGDVDRTKEKIFPEAPITPQFDNVEYAAIIVDNFDNIEPVIEEHSGYVNLFPIVLPENVSIATTPFTDHLDIYKTSPQVRFPAFLLKNKVLFTFEDLEKSILRKYVNIHTIETKKIEFWIREDKKNENILTIILNKWIDNCCRNDGMWYNKRTRTYFFPRPRGKARPLLKTWVSPKNVKRPRTVTKPYIKDRIINFWAHRSVQIRALNKWGGYNLYIRPRWLFSEDGLKILEGEKADKLDRSFRKSIYNRNKNLLYDTLFWYDILFKHTTKDTPERLDKFTLLGIPPDIEVLNCIEFKLYRKPNSEIEEIREMDDSDMVLTLDDFRW